MPKTELRFSVDSQLIGELGERLVTKNHVALSELVKNAYDADATDLTVTFINAGEGGDEGNKAEIHIIDNGVGMRYRDVRAYWMRIATPVKRREPISTLYGRPKTGNKGIGRFACQRLARKLELIAVSRDVRNRLEKTTVLFDWARFKPGSDLTSVRTGAAHTLVSSGKPGVVLKLKDLRDRWTQRDFDILRRHLLLLSMVREIDRRGYEADPGFRVELDASEFERGKGILADQAFDAGWGTLTGQVQGNGTIELTLDAKLIGRKTYTLPAKFKRIRHVELEIANLPRKRAYLRDSKTLTLSTVDELRSAVGGIRVYLDGFRVYPYGDTGDDWLNLDRDVSRRVETPDQIFKSLLSKMKLDAARPLLDLPTNNRLIGRIFVDSQKVPGLDVKLDREGFVESPTFDELVQLARMSIEWMTLHYSVFKTRLAAKEFAAEARLFAEGELDGTPVPSESVRAAVSYLEAAGTRDTAKISLPPDRVRRASKVVKRALEVRDAEIAVLQTLASTGPVVFAFAHELRAATARLDLHAATLDNLSRKVKERGSAVALRSAAEQLRSTRARIDKQFKLFGVLAKSHAAGRRRHYLRKALSEVSGGFEAILEEAGVNLDYTTGVPDNLKIGPIRDAELYAILVNLLSNAMKAVIAGGGEKIKITAKAGPLIRIRFLDDGIGLSRRYWESVFEPLAADPENKLYKRLQSIFQESDVATLGKGTGMGLSIVRGLATSYGGTAKFTAAPRGWKTCVEVSLK